MTSAAPARSFLSDLAWLSAVFIAFAFVTTRTSLILHELVGHGAVALALGADIKDFRLFVFGGGLIRYARSEPFDLVEGLALSLGGIALQLVLGAGLVLLARRASPGLWRGLALAAAMMNILHAGFYFVMATHYDFGDGRVLAGWLGAHRVWVVGAGAALLVAGGYGLARLFARQAASWVRRPGRASTVLLLVGAALSAGAVHGAAMLGEQAITADERYARIMQHGSERAAERELALRRAREELTPEEVARLRQALAEQHRPFPLRPLLVVVLGAAVLAGATRAASETPRAARPPRRALWALGGGVVAALGLVALLSSPWWRAAAP